MLDIGVMLVEITTVSMSFGFPIDIPYRHLALRVRPQKVESSRTPQLGLALHQACARWIGRGISSAVSLHA